MAIAHWPLSELRIVTPRLELVYPTDDVLSELVEVAVAGVHDPAEMPFSVPWTDVPEEELVRGFFQYHWNLRASWSPTRWELALAVMVDGRAIGTQGVNGTDFAITRLVSTGSWIGRTHQRQGIGREMRSAILHLAFAGLDAEVATTEAFADNPASLGVTRSLGYAPDGEHVLARRDRPARMLRFRLARDEWSRRRRDDIAIAGLDGCRSWFGL